jgi:hypothetical protein
MAGPISEMRWRPLGSIDPLRLKEARLQAHYALQWLARAARAYIPSQPDDSHTCLHWDSALDAFMTQSFANGTRLLLQIPALTLTVQSDEGTGGSQSFALDRRTDAQVREWLGKQLEAQRLAPSALDEPAPYEIPAQAIAQGAAYEAQAEADGLAVLAGWYANAAVLIESLRLRIAGERLAVSAPCCWPHHFDLAILAMLTIGHSAEPGLIGVGLSPGDEYYDEPYYYVSVYPEPRPEALPALPVVGGWHTRDFTAAVASAQKILAAKDPEIETGRFLDEAIGASLGLLSQTSKR